MRKKTVSARHPLFFSIGKKTGLYGLANAMQYGHRITDHLGDVVSSRWEDLHVKMAAGQYQPVELNTGKVLHSCIIPVRQAPHLVFCGNNDYCFDMLDLSAEEPEVYCVFNAWSNGREPYSVIDVSPAKHYIFAGNESGGIVLSRLSEHGHIDPFYFNEDDLFKGIVFATFLSETTVFVLTQHKAGIVDFSSSEVAIYEINPEAGIPHFDYINRAAVNSDRTLFAVNIGQFIKVFNYSAPYPAEVLADIPIDYYQSHEGAQLYFQSDCFLSFDLRHRLLLWESYNGRPSIGVYDVLSANAPVRIRRVPVSDQPVYVSGVFSSPDGRFILYSTHAQKVSDIRIIVFDLERERQVFSTDISRTVGISAASFSEDNQYLTVSFSCYPSPLTQIYRLV